MDLILCRNVLLYLDDETAGHVIDGVVGSLSENGWLLLSNVEGSLRVFDGLVRDDAGPSIYRRRKKPIPVVMVSADASRGQSRRFLAAGARDYLTKRFDVGHFLNVVDDVVAGA
jgi:DNA-binding NarL/FixJ family response regulator